MSETTNPPHKFPRLSGIFSKRDPKSKMSMFNNMHDRLSKASTGAHGAVSKARAFANKQIGAEYVDLQIQFIGASGLPKMDVVGSCDPYFIANLDTHIKFVSTVQVNTLAPIWNEIWRVKNVPIAAQLTVEVLDKDNGPTDDYIGRFRCDVDAGTKEFEIESALLKRTKGMFWLKIESSPPSMPDAPPYSFDGPIRFSRHSSPTVGHLTNLNDKRLYSTWKMFIKGVPIFFGDATQHWNVNYKAAQTIFGHTPASLAVRSSIQMGHKMLYARSTNNGFGIIEKPGDLLQTFSDDVGGTGGAAKRVKPAVYTYVIAIEDSSFRFSETGAAFFVDFASKHALHANCSESVRYSGEFHLRPEGGWANFSDDVPDDGVKWELVIDNNSGTYSPDKNILPRLKQVLEYNFPGIGIVALDHEDPALKESREACREYALKFRGVKQEDLQPHAQPGDETLLHYIQAGNPIELGPNGPLS